MKYDVELKCMIDGYLKQAKIKMDDRDLKILATHAEEIYENTKNPTIKDDVVNSIVEKYGLRDVWEEFMGQIQLDLSYYIDDMSNPELFCNKNFSRKDLVEGTYFLVDWCGPTIAKLTKIDKNRYIFERNIEDTKMNWIELDESDLDDFIQDVLVEDKEYLKGKKFTKDMRFARKGFSNKKTVHFSKVADLLIEVDEYFDEDELTEAQHNEILSGDIMSKIDADDETDPELIAKKVAEYFKVDFRNSKNFSNTHIHVKSGRNFSHKNFNDENYPDEEEATTKVNFDGTKLPVRVRFTMQNPRY